MTSALHLLGAIKEDTDARGWQRTADESHENDSFSTVSL